MWRVMREALLFYGFPMKHINTAGEPANFNAEGLHINPLEFIAIIINVWLALKLLETCPHVLTGYIITLLFDNTSAISWLQTAGNVRTLESVVLLVLLPLSLFEHALSPLFSTPDTFLACRTTKRTVSVA